LIGDFHLRKILYLKSITESLVESIGCQSMNQNLGISIIDNIDK